MSSSKKRKRKQVKRKNQEVVINDTDMTFGKIKVSALAIALGIGLISLTQYLILSAAIIVSIICVLLMIPFVGFIKVYFNRAQRKLKIEHIPTLQKHVGFNTFFSNKQVIYHDVVLIVSVLLTIAAIIFQWTSILFWATIRMFGIYAFLVHCFYNGKVYNALQNYENMKS